MSEIIFAMIWLLCGVEAMRLGFASCRLNHHRGLSCNVAALFALLGGPLILVALAIQTICETRVDQ